jgi:hypothetical protein
MDRPPVPVDLPNEDAGPLRVRRAVLDDNGRLDTADYLTCKDTVRDELVVAVSGNPHLPALDQVDDKPERLAHALTSSGGLVQRSFTLSPWANAPFSARARARPLKPEVGLRSPRGRGQINLARPA